MTESEQQVRLVSRKKDFAWHLACGFCFVAVADSIVSGFIYAYEISNTHKVYIEYIAVEPSMQGMGIGQKLFAALRTQCRKKHIRSIWSLINTDNTRSLKFHQRAGCVLRPRIEAEYLL
jgi:L-amino acid N-acyltransferase YncA